MQLFTKDFAVSSIAFSVWDGQQLIFLENWHWFSWSAFCTITGENTVIRWALGNHACLVCQRGLLELSSSCYIAESSCSLYITESINVHTVTLLQMAAHEYTGCPSVLNTSFLNQLANLVLKKKAFQDSVFS